MLPSKKNQNKNNKDPFRFVVIILLGGALALTVLFLDVSDYSRVVAFSESLYQTVFNKAHKQIQLLSVHAEELYKIYYQGKKQQADINELRQETLSLKLQLREIRFAREENLKLRKLLKIKEGFRHKTTFANIISHDSQNHFFSFIVDKGSHAKIRLHQPVLASTSEHLALVGFVVSVADEFSEVRTILDHRSHVSIMIGSEESLGIMLGQSRSSVLLNIDFINIVLDDLLYKEVFTSGLGEKYPRGLSVGRIVEIDKPSFGVFQKASLASFIDFFTLKEVLIIGPEEDKS